MALKIEIPKETVDIHLMADMYTVFGGTALGYSRFEKRSGGLEL